MSTSDKKEIGKETFQGKKTFEKLFGPNGMSGGGFSYIPKVLFLLQKESELSDEELIVLLNYLIEYRIGNYRTSMSPKFLMERTGKSLRSMQRVIHSLRDKGWLKPEKKYLDVRGAKIRSFSFYPAIQKINILFEKYKDEKVQKEKKVMENIEKMEMEFLGKNEIVP